MNNTKQTNGHLHMRVLRSLKWHERWLGCSLEFVCVSNHHHHHHHDHHETLAGEAAAVCSIYGRKTWKMKFVFGYVNEIESRGAVQIAMEALTVELV